MQVKSEMTKKVEIVNPSTSLKEAARKMKDFNIGVLPVYEKDKLLGIVTDRDITLRSTAEGKDPSFTTVKEIMTPQVEWCFEDDNLQDVALKMEQKKIRRIPVMDHYKKLVGILSIGDLAVRGSRDVACEILEKVAYTS
jgi:CBS domain-containing protein